MTDPSSPATLARMIRQSVPLLTRFLRGFDEGNRTSQRPGLPNHPAWILGHCAFTMAKLASLAGGPTPPERDFAPGNFPSSDRLPGTTPDRCFIEDIAKDSHPIDDSRRYPSLARATEIFERAASDLANFIESLPPAQLERLIDWNGSPQRIDDMAMRLSFHNGMHAGQLTDLRRALKFDRVLP